MKHIDDVSELADLCLQSRRDILTMVHHAGSGHPGGSLSATEIIVVLFNSILHHDHNNPSDDHRDRFILSKGHCTPIYYSVLSRTGYFNHDELLDFRKMNSRLQGHPDRSKFDLMETTTGSLGQGLSIAAGKAFALKIDRNPAKIYCMIGDGELDEGQIWESLATIKKYNLSNMIIILDNNKVQLDGSNKDIKDLEPIAQKFKAFGYDVLEVDGHHIRELLNTLHYAKRLSDEGKNIIIQAHTIKGKGISFMENTAEWHGKSPNKEQYEKAMSELK